MSQAIDPSKSDAAAAIDEVLVAETAVREAMEACRQEADRVLDAAREDARRIARNASQRASRLHARCNQLVARQIEGIRRAAGIDAPRTELNAEDRERLAAAVARLAARLTRPSDG